MDPFDLIGDVLDGQFRVEEFVGEGALSVVYRARNLSLDVPACVKCLNLPTTLDPVFARSVIVTFQEGCKLHFKLARGHLAIAQTFTSGTTEAPRTGAQVHYIVREWFDGESLVSNLRRRRVEGEQGRSLAETIALFDPIASALTYAQEQGSEHLSLMPSNMFLAKTAAGEALKLLDFGVGAAVDEAASSSRSDAAVVAPQIKLLLPTYAAPEQLLSTLGPTGPWTDVYALALVLLEVLSDKPVMSEKDASALVARALNKTVRPTPRAHGIELPDDVEHALTRALSLEPELRQATVAELWKEITTAARPARNERRRLATHLRRLRRIRKASRGSADATSQSLPPGECEFPNEEAPTTKVRGVVAMLTASAARGSARPPPMPTRSSPPKVEVVPKAQARELPHVLLPSPLPLPSLSPSPSPSTSPSPSLTRTASPTRTSPSVTRTPPPIPPPPPIRTPPPTPSPLLATPPPALGDQEPPPPPPELASILIAHELAAPAVPPVAPALTTHAARAQATAAALATPPPAPAPLPAVLPLPPPIANESNGRLQAHEISLIASPLALPRRAIDRRLIVAGAGAAMLLSVVVLVVALVRHRSRATEVRAPTIASTRPPSMTTTAPPPTPPSVATSSATQPAEVVVPPVPTIRPGRFNRQAALAAIADATADLSSCRRKGGVWGKAQAGVSFYNDGSVRMVFMSAPLRGPEGDCVRKRITEQVHIDPFLGIWGPVYAYFVIPY